MKTSHVTVGLTAGFIASVFALHWWQRTSYPLWLWGIVVAAFLIAFLLRRRKRVLAETAVAILIGVSLALLRVGAVTHVTTERDIERFATGGTATITGRIAEAPERRLLQARYVIDVETVKTQEGTSPARGKVLTIDPYGWPPHFLGDTVTARGTLALPDPSVPGYARSLALRGIRAVMTRTTLAAVPDRPLRPWDRFLRILTASRTTFEAAINRMQPEPHASLLAGLLTGNRSGIPEAETDAFRRSGISHIIAISGYNVTIILAVMGGMLFFVPRRPRFWFLLLGIVLFTLFTGAGATVLRAAIMGILGLLALETGRTASVRLLMLWTAFLMLLWQPTALTDDVSFQLSFLSVIGLSELGPWLQRMLRFLPDQLNIREAFTATLAAQIATLPVIATTFRSVSLIAPVTNLLVAPLVPLAMLFGFIGTIIGMLIPPAGLAVSYLAWGFMEAIFQIANTLAMVPWGAISF